MTTYSRITRIAFALVACALAAPCLAQLELTSVQAVDPQGDPGLLRYEYKYTNRVQDHPTFTIALAAAEVTSFGGPEGGGWYTTFLGGEGTPTSVVWYAQSTDDMVPPGEMIAGLYVESRSEPAPARWRSVAYDAENPNGQGPVDKGLVLGPNKGLVIEQSVQPPAIDAPFCDISFPLFAGTEPEPFDPALVFDFDDLNGKLFNVAPTPTGPMQIRIITYPGDFSEVSLGLGYFLRVPGGELRPNYFGLKAPPLYHVKIPGPGWLHLGCPRNRPVPMPVISVIDLNTGERRFALEDMQSGDPWLNWKWYYYNPITDTQEIASPDGDYDDVMVRPWFGYKVWANRGGVAVLIPDTG
jgi:hypothetical protein